MKRLPNSSIGLSMLLMALVASPLAMNVGIDISPAFADKGGNGKGGGNGNHGGNGNNGNHGNKGNHGGNANGHQAGAAKSASSKKSADTQLAGIPANQLGRLNGFLHANSRALLNTSEKSAIGKLSKTYAGQLSAYLGGVTEAADLNTKLATLNQQLEDLKAEPTPDQATIDKLEAEIDALEQQIADTEATTQQDLAAAAATIEDAANKPLSPEIIAVVNARLGTLYGPTDPNLAPYASANDPASIALANSIFGQVTP